jgi:hypothetical protein
MDGWKRVAEGVGSATVAVGRGMLIMHCLLCFPSTADPNFRPSLACRGVAGRRGTRASGPAPLIRASDPDCDPNHARPYAKRQAEPTRFLYAVLSGLWTLVWCRSSALTGCASNSQVGQVALYHRCTACALLLAPRCSYRCTGHLQTRTGQHP